MKNQLITLALLASFFSVNAQEKTYFHYKTEDKRNKLELDIKSNDNYLTNEKSGLKGMAANFYGTRLLDFKNGVGVIHTDKEGKWYIMETLDNMYKDANTMKKESEKKNIGSYSCTKYTAQSKVDMPGPYGAKMRMDYDYTFWVAEDIKISPMLKKYLVAQATTDIFNGEIPGLLVQIDYKVSMNGKKVSEGSTILEKATEDKLKDAEVMLPWKDKSYHAAAAREDHAAGTGSIAMPGSLWTKETSAVYEERIKQLIQKVTGIEVKKLILVRANSYM